MIKKFDAYLDSVCVLLAGLLLVVILKVPTFFEPYWYGDEAIYLTLGTAMRSGVRLYLEIIDHKTPIIYYLAMVPTQLDFRLLLTFWMLISSVAFFGIVSFFFKSKISIYLSFFGFIVLTSLPWFEGTIPNGELFVMGFVLVALALCLKIPLFAHFFSPQKSFADSGVMIPTTAGFLLGLAILTKVPALFDALAVLSVGWFLYLAQLYKKQPRNLRDLLFTLFELKPFLYILAGIILPIVLSCIYFVLRGSGQAYLDFGLLYNFRYAGSWQPHFSSMIIGSLFSFKGKIFLAGLALISLSLGYKSFSKVFLFSSTWFVLSLFASLLSNRPYPHYFLQVIPALVLVVGTICETLISFFYSPTQKLEKNIQPPLFTRLSECVLSSSFVIIFILILKLLGVGLYQTIPYFSTFYSYISGQITKEQYYNRFDSLMSDNYAVAPLLANSGEQKLFIWGTNPTLYALTQMVPVGRFTVSFHIKDFKAHAETLAAVKKEKPKFIIIMNDDAHTFPELNSYIEVNYIPNQSFKHFTLWKRL